MAVIKHKPKTVPVAVGPNGASRKVQRRVIDPMKSKSLIRPGQGSNRPDLMGAEAARWGMNGC